MFKILYSWRFYSFGREQYQECMSYVFNNNLLNLRQANMIVAIFATIFSFYPMLVERDIVKGFFYLGVAVVAIIMSFAANFIMQQINVRKRVIYSFIILFYINVIFFGTYVSVWTNRDQPATIFVVLLMCALLYFSNPPHFNLVLTVCSLFIFNIICFIIKQPGIWLLDMVNSLAAASLGVFLSWHFTKLRLGLEISTSELEDERNKYIDQSITDELTQLRNRRDFFATFERFLSNYRVSDDWLCVALADIDFFKFYNDHYGHPKGDDCLRGIGQVLNGLSSLGVYAARVGGEEFALLWFEKDAANVNKIVIQWTDRIRDLKIPHEKSKVSQYVTMSIGIYIVRCGVSHDTQALYDYADKALYTAKGSGRNCAIIVGDEIKQYKLTPKDND
ncbi:MAG: GGDEF domain-containing protein [Treponema sp.]|nr:GGDEF domain-containing protein [Treponema sp.]